MVLEPGDVLATSTPAGVGQVHDGDEVVFELANIGPVVVASETPPGARCAVRRWRRGPLSRKRIPGFRHAAGIVTAPSRHVDEDSPFTARPL
ncbi:fumarylacetoacetate hydrolase family protein [Rhodococcus sp. IEGM1428]|uniref:fumarylacetoacetate hydrolase family protein n=1 Tax=Rhodococcus sp. IEGM1428 TaxID=3392191 RepID=UPI003D0E5EA0